MTLNVGDKVIILYLCKDKVKEKTDTITEVATLSCYKTKENGTLKKRNNILGIDYLLNENGDILNGRLNK